MRGREEPAMHLYCAGVPTSNRVMQQTRVTIVLTCGYISMATNYKFKEQGAQINQPICNQVN